MSEETNVEITAEMQVGKPSKEDIKRVEEHFIKVCKRDFIKWNTNKFLEYQSQYFCGAMMMCNYAVPSWSILLIGRRPIVEKY